MEPVTEPSALLVTTIALTLEAFLLPLADVLREAGWRVDAMASGAPTCPALHDHFDGLHNADWSRRLADPGNFIGTPRHTRATVKQGGYDIVHVHTPIAGFITRYALRSMTGADAPRVIYTAHGFHFHSGGSSVNNLAFRAAEKKAARWTDYIVTMNAEDFEAARGLGTIAQERVRLIPGIGVDPVAYRADLTAGARVRRSLGFGDETFVIAMIAEMNENKRHRLVLDAVAAMQHSATLVLVGSGPLESDLRVRATALGIADRVRFLGTRSDVAAVLAAADVLTLASVREGLPRSVLEAMAAGVPVVGTRTRGVVDLLESGAGWIADAEPAALAGALDRAAASPEERRVRGRAGQEAVRASYSQRAITDAYLELYAEALTHARR